MLKLVNVVKTYVMGDSKVEALKGISVNFRKNEFVSILGPSGCGKSTLLKVLSGIITTHEGEVLLNQEVLNPHSHKIGLIPQNFGLLPWKTVQENCLLSFKIKKEKITSSTLEKMDQMMRRLNIDHLKKRYPHELSGGQRQRAYIAMVIAQNSDYIFLDEPLNNLDMKHSVEIMKTLRKLCDELNKTVVIVIHDINFASCYSDYIVALKDGKLVKNGVTEETIQKEELENIYEIDFHIENINNRNICVYF